MSQKMTKNKWTTKNVITLAVFTFIIVVLINIDSMLLNLLITPLGAYFVVAGISAVVCGPFYMVMVNNIAKRGVFFFTCLLSGLIFILTGYFVSTVTFIIAGVIGEICMLGQDAYHSFIRNMIGYYIYMLGYIGGLLLPMLLFRQQYLEWYSQYADAEAVDVMLRFFSSALGPLTSLCIMTIGCVIGALIGRIILNRHVKKVRI